MLRKLGFDVAISHDAGLFICNYIFYQSLRHCALAVSETLHSLFVHVPQFEKIAIDDQMRFMLATINSITKLLTTSETVLSTIQQSSLPVKLVA